MRLDLTNTPDEFQAAYKALACPMRCNEGMVERLASPDEVDAGCELGVAFDPCPVCRPQETE